MPAVRALRTLDDFNACVALQKRTWGDDFNDLVPAHLVKVAQRIGGVATGAFDEQGEMLGFVFGITGVHDGELVHWSDMLAVRSEARGHGIGRLLKEHQRDQVRAMGINLIQWTFDPLVARNAHLNLARLGAEVSEYVPDMYGDSNSLLHQGLGTDRFVVSWRTEENRRPAPPLDGSESAPILNVDSAGLPVQQSEIGQDAGALRVEVPADIHEVLKSDPRRARAWRESTRRAFLQALESGYRVRGFVRDEESGRCFYVLADSNPEPKGR